MVKPTARRRHIRRRLFNVATQGLAIQPRRCRFGIFSFFNPPFPKHFFHKGFGLILFLAFFLPSFQVTFKGLRSSFLDLPSFKRLAAELHFSFAARQIDLLFSTGDICLPSQKDKLVSIEISIQLIFNVY